MGDLELVSEAEPVPALTFQDWYSMAARRKLGLPDGWRWWKVESISGGILIHGNVPTVLPGGKLKWPSKATDTVLVLQPSEVEATKKAWEAETGKCGECSGHGKAYVGWSLAEGQRVKVCRACNGSGKVSP